MSGTGRAVDESMRLEPEPGFFGRLDLQPNPCIGSGTSQFQECLHRSRSRREADIRPKRQGPKSAGRSVLKCSLQCGISSNCGRSSGLFHFKRRVVNISAFGAIKSGRSRLPSWTNTVFGKPSRFEVKILAPQSGQKFRRQKPTTQKRLSGMQQPRSLVARRLRHAFSVTKASVRGLFIVRRPLYALGHIA
jgi:hypothetical protein